MTATIKSHTLGKLRIYLANGDKVTSDTLMRKVFPKTIHKEIVLEAKKDGIMNASVYTTQLGYSNNGTVTMKSLETDNKDMTVCIELIDTKERLEAFVTKHKAMLKNKVLIYKNVEFWDID